MPRRLRFAVAFAVLLALLVPGSARAGDAGREAVERAAKSLSEAGAALADLAKSQLEEGDTDAVRETLALLDRILELKRDLLGLTAAPAPGPAPRRLRDVRPEGGTKVTQTALDLALEWLRLHQDENGAWDCDGFMKHDRVPPVCDGGGHALYDPGVTGLALLAYLGAGQTHQEGSYRETVTAALRYLMAIQDPEGCFGPRTTQHFTYAHAICAQAMAEAYSLTGSTLFERPAQLGLDFVAKAQNPYLAWRYGVRPGDNDTSVTAWMVAALAAGKRAGLRVGSEGFDGARAWLDKATEPEYGRVGYTARGTGSARPQDLMDRFPADKSEALTAAGMLTRMWTGEDPRSSEMIQKGAELCRKALPRWDQRDGSIDMYYWYWGSRALFQVGGSAWKEWNEAVRAAVIDHQRKDSPSFAGSWDPVGAWGRDGGRVYSTALCAMILETYWQERIFTAPPARRSFGGR